AAFSGIHITTFEPDEAEREVVALARSQGWDVAAWDVAGGLRLPGNAASDAGPGDPGAALRALPTFARPDRTALLLLHQFNRYLSNPEVAQTAFTQLVAASSAAPSWRSWRRWSSCPWSWRSCSWWSSTRCPTAPSARPSPASWSPTGPRTCPRART